MKRKLDPDAPYGKLVRIPDFLPPPDQLVLPRDEVKVTISLSRSSVAFFKDRARRHHTKYQRMIREVLDRYAARYAARD